ncbi:hypothetical protein KEM55_001282, partial [Ascosphaera atra]
VIYSDAEQPSRSADELKIFKFIDENGQLHDTPPPKPTAPFRPSPLPPAVPAAPAAASSAAPSAAPSAPSAPSASPVVPVHSQGFDSVVIQSRAVSGAEPRDSASSPASSAPVLRASSAPTLSIPAFSCPAAMTATTSAAAASVPPSAPPVVPAPAPARSTTLPPSAAPPAPAAPASSAAPAAAPVAPPASMAPASTAAPAASPVAPPASSAVGLSPLCRGLIPAHEVDFPEESSASSSGAAPSIPASPVKSGACQRRSNERPMFMEWLARVGRGAAEAKCEQVLTSVLAVKRIVRERWVLVEGGWLPRRPVEFSRPVPVWEDLQPTQQGCIVGHTGGEVEEEGCRRCRAGCGVLRGCVRVAGWGSGACMSCYWYGKPERCSLQPQGVQRKRKALPKGGTRSPQKKAKQGGEVWEVAAVGSGGSGGGVVGAG